MTPLAAWVAKWGCHAEAYKELVQIVAHTTEVPPPHANGLRVSEGTLQAYLRVHAPKLGFALWRNNNGACKDETGRLIRYGLGNDSAKLNMRWKSSDLIGIGPGGKFVAIEVKAPGWRGPANDRERAQANFINTVNALGGAAGFATAIDDYERIIAS